MPLKATNITLIHPIRPLIQIRDILPPPCNSSDDKSVLSTITSAACKSVGHNMLIGCHFETHESSMSSADHASAIDPLKKYDIRWLKEQLKRAWP